MSSRDINLLSFNGPHDNGRFVSWGKPLVPGQEIADTIKCSTGLTGFSAHFGVVHAGREDALDVNNLCRDVAITAERWVFTPRTRMGFTIKGGSRNITVVGLVDGDPLVDIGNASDQSHAMTTGVRLDLRRVDGKPIRVRVLGGDLPDFMPGSGPYRFVFPWRSRILRVIATKTFLQLRRHFSV